VAVEGTFGARVSVPMGPAVELQPSTGVVGAEPNRHPDATGLAVSPGVPSAEMVEIRFGPNRGPGPVAFEAVGQPALPRPACVGWAELTREPDSVTLAAGPVAPAEEAAGIRVNGISGPEVIGGG